MKRATPEQKRALAMAATDAKGWLTREAGGYWRKASEPWAGPDQTQHVGTATIHACISRGWFKIQATFERHGATDVVITVEGATEALRP